MSLERVKYTNPEHRALRYEVAIDGALSLLSSVFLTPVEAMNLARKRLQEAIAIEENLSQRARAAAQAAPICALCQDPILPTEDSVEISSEPYNLRPGGEAHKECAEDAMIQAIAANQDAGDVYENR